MNKVRSDRLGYLLLIYCLCPTPIRSSEMEVVNVPLGTSCNITKYLVDPNSIFNIDTLDRTSDDDRKFVDCEMSFTSSREDGRLCIIQDGPVNEIKDSNVEMVVKENTTLVFKLVYYPSRWGVREYCTQSPSLNVALKKININNRVDVRKVAITLKIVNIESRNRTMYFNDISCANTYKLRNSWINVYNRSPHSPKTLEYCGLKAEKEGNNNRSICLIYKPLLDTQPQDTEWKFYVSTEHFNLDPNFFIYELNSKSSQARKPHAWCADPDVRSVTLIFHRLNMTNEQQDMFVFTLTDHQGSNDTLFKLWSNMPSTHGRPAAEPGASSSFLNVSILIVLVILVVLFLILTEIFNLCIHHYCKKVMKVTNLKIDQLDNIKVLDSKSEVLDSLKAYPAHRGLSEGTEEQTYLTESEIRKQKIDNLQKVLQGNPYSNMSLLKQKFLNSPGNV